jgi:predicted dehydrogenase
VSLANQLPASRVPEPAEAPPLRWGVVGTGWIAERFVDAVQSKTRQQVAAVGSRSGAGAASFARRFGIPRPHGSYEDLVTDPEVDAVYVATPHPSHLPHGLLALNAGKHVLIEKPLALNAREAHELQARASELGLYCAEAMWTLFTPKFDVIGQIIDSERTGLPVAERRPAQGTGPGCYRRNGRPSIRHGPDREHHLCDHCRCD